MSQTEFINQTPYGYSNAVAMTGGRLIYITGQMARDEHGQLVGVGDFRAQTQRVFENLRDQLAAAGATFDHVVKIDVLATESFMEDMFTFGEIRDSFVNTEHPPASGIVLAPTLVDKDALIDIAVTAHISG